MIPETELDKLAACHGGYWDGEVPQYPKEDWRYAVDNNDTLSGYWEWAYAKLEQENDG